MVKTSRIKPQQTDTETDTALARAYALLIRVGERTALDGSYRA